MVVFIVDIVPVDTSLPLPFIIIIINKKPPSLLPSFPLAPLTSRHYIILGLLDVNHSSTSTRIPVHESLYSQPLILSSQFSVLER